MRHTILTTSLLLAATLTSATVDAAEGALEINQLCVATGCFAGDSPGFPVEITAPGYYRLTSNLDIRGEPSPGGVTAVLVTSGGVDLDLAGFALIGPVTCTGSPAVTACSGSGSGDGIVIDGADIDVAVHDGTVQGFARYGVRCDGARCRLDRLLVTSNRLEGVRGFGFGAEVYAVDIHASRMTRNGGEGANIIGTVSDSLAAQNMGTGIQVSGGQVLHSSSRQNGENGFQLLNSIGRSLTATENGQLGIDCAGCTLLDSRVIENQGLGVDIDNGSIAGGNRILDNAGGDVSGTPGLEVQESLCSFAVLCWP